MKRHFGWAFCAATACFAGCVDASPIDYVEPEDAGVADANNVDAQTIAACEECVVNGACSALFAQCAQDAKYNAFAHCLIDTYCFDWNARFQRAFPRAVSR